MPTKHLPLAAVELKLSGEHTFTGYAARFNTVDQGGDAIMPGAFDQTLKDRATRPLLWQHDTRTPIGVEHSLKVDANGLLGEWEIVDTQAGADAYKLMKKGAVTGMSIGYMPSEVEFSGDTRKLLAIDLLENSVVTLPMHEDAQIQSVKSLGDLFDRPLAEVGQHITTELSRFVAEAKALHERRRDDGRELAEAHTAAIAALMEQAEAVLGLKSLLPAEPVSGDPALDAIRLKLALGRLKRLAHTA